VTALAGMLAGEIRPGEFQGMAALDAWTYEDLKADIQENGVEVPIVVNQDYVIVDGHNRFAIAQELGIVDSLPVEVHTYGSVAATQAAAIRLNVNRRQIGKDQRNQYVIQMRELMGMTQREVADRLGISRNRVSQIEADSPTSITDVGESDPLETAKVKAFAGKGKGRGAYKFTPRESAAVQAEVERLHDQGMTCQRIADEVGIVASAVARRLRRNDEPDPKSMQEQIAECAARGMTSTQIADAVGHSVEWVRAQSRRHGIEIPADRTSYKKRIDADAAMTRAVEHLGDAMYAFTHIPTSDLDAAQVQEWSCSLDEVAKSIRTLIRQLNQLTTKEQDQS
jgi:predicted transcriptional regulator